MKFKNRIDAAEQLSKLLADYLSLEKRKDFLVLAIPRGGLQIGEIVAKNLKANLSIIASKKIPHPANKELAIGALGPKRTVVLNQPLISEFGISHEYIESKIKELSLAIKEKYMAYTGSENPIDVKDKVVIVVDDGIATGNTMFAAVRYLAKAGARKIIVSAPVCSYDAKELLSREAELVCLHIPEFFYAVGQFYKEFPQLNDNSAIAILREFKK